MTAFPWGAGDKVYKDDFNAMLRGFWAVTGGSGAAYTLTTGAANLTAYFTGMEVAFQASFTCNAAPTLNVDNIGAVNLYLPNGTQAGSGEVVSGRQYKARYDGTKFVLRTVTALTEGATSNADALHNHRLFDTVYQAMIANSKTHIGSMNDGFTAISSSVAATRDVFETILTPSSGGGGQAYLLSPILYANANWDNNPNITCAAYIKAANASGVTAFMGLFDSPLQIAPATATLTARHAAFLRNGSTIYASVGDGTTQNRVDVSSGLTLTNWNLFEIVFTGGSNAVLRVNGTTVATLSTNLPTSSGSGIYLSFCTATTAGTGMNVRHPYAVKLSNLLT